MNSFWLCMEDWWTNWLVEQCVSFSACLWVCKWARMCPLCLWLCKTKAERGKGAELDVYPVMVRAERKSLWILGEQRIGELNQMEQSILRAKIQKGFPLPVRSKLAEVVGLGSMTNGVYTNHIAHQVELYRKKEQDLRDQNQETLRKLTQIQLLDNKKEKKQALVIKAQPNQPLPRQQPDQNQFQSAQPLFAAPIAFSLQPVFGQLRPNSYRPHAWVGYLLIW